MGIKLLPCPFCGGNASIERYGDRRQSTQYTCDHCGCFLETGEEWDHGRIWNERIEDERVQKLKKIVEVLLEAADQGKMVASSGITGMTIEAQMRGSVYNKVPVWPFEQARIDLEEIFNEGE